MELKGEVIYLDADHKKSFLTLPVSIFHGHRWYRLAGTEGGGLILTAGDPPPRDEKKT